jgi:hypothetical protein
MLCVVATAAVGTAAVVVVSLHLRLQRVPAAIEPSVMVYALTLSVLVAMVARGLCLAMQLGAMMYTWPWTKLLERRNGLLAA